MTSPTPSSHRPHPPRQVHETGNADPPKETTPKGVVSALCESDYFSIFPVASHFQSEIVALPFARRREISAARGSEGFRS